MMLFTFNKTNLYELEWSFECRDYVSVDSLYFDVCYVSVGGEGVMRPAQKFLEIYPFTLCPMT